MEFQTFDEMVNSNASQSQRKLLNLERFNLLPQNIQDTVNAEREVGNFPMPMEKIGEEEFNSIKDLLGMFVGPNVAKSDEDFARLFYTLQRTGNFITDKDVLREAAAITGGIVAPSFLPGVGQATLPARVAAFIEKYPRYSRVISAFFGGATGSAPFSDSYLQVLGYGAREAFGEGAFQVIHKYFPFLRDMVKGKDGEALETASKTSQKILSDEGASLTPARISKNPNVDMIEQLAETSFFGANIMRIGSEEAQRKGTELLVKYINKEVYPNSGEVKLVESFVNKASMENVDDLVKNFLLDGRDFYKGAVDGAYKNLNKKAKTLLGNNKIVDTKKLLKSFDRQIKLQGGDINDPTVQALRNYIKQFAETGKGGVDFLAAKNIRTHLLSKTNFYTTQGTTPPTYLNKIAGDMANYMTKLMKDSVNAQVKSGKLSKEQAKELLGAYTVANNTYKQGKRTFNTKFISQILLGEDTAQITKATLNAQEQIFKELFEQGNKPGRAKHFFKLLNDGVSKGVITKEGADNITKRLQGEWFRQTLVKAIDPKSGVLDPTKIIQATQGTRGSTGLPILNELFKGKDKAIIDNMKKYLDTLVLAQSRGIEKQKGSLAFITAQFAAAGAVPIGVGGFLLDFQLAGLGGVVLGLGTLLGPRSIAKAFTNKEFVSNLINLEKAKVGTSNYTRSAIQLINNMVANKFVDPILAKRFVNEAVVEGIFEDSDKDKMKWYDGVEDTDLTGEEADNPAILDAQGEFNKAPPGLLEQLNIPTLETASARNLPNSPPPSSSISDIDLSSIGGGESSTSPETLASLESVGLPLFEANEGGLASVDFKKFKKPQVVS